VSNALSRRQKVRKNLSICTKTSPEDEEEAIVTSAKIRNSVAQLVPPSTIADITLPEIVWDTGNFAQSPNELTAPVSGLYLIGINLTVQGPFPPSTSVVSINAVRISPLTGILEIIQVPTQAAFVATTFQAVTLFELLAGNSLKFTLVNNDPVNTMTIAFGHEGRGAWMLLTEIL